MSSLIIPASWVPANQKLMQKVREDQGRLIQAACARSAIAPAFMAALVAGESGGDPAARRFEPRVLQQIWAVLLGRSEKFGMFDRAQLLASVSAEASPMAASIYGAAPSILRKLDDLASSLGLTQVMGYNALAHGIQPTQLAEPSTCLMVTIAMLDGFMKHWKLDPGDSEALLRCWNTGRPDGMTADAWYVSNGLARIKLWEEAAVSAG